MKVRETARIGRAAGSVRGQLLVGACFLLACVVGKGGLLSGSYADDLPRYQQLATLVLHGHVPYRDFYVEYPPGSFVAFLVPELAGGSAYQLIFKLFMAACGVVALLATLRYVSRAGGPAAGSYRAAALWIVAPLVLGPVLLNRYDLWPAALTAVALVLLVDGRDVGAGALLGVAFAAKLYPLLAAPAVAIWILRRSGRRRLVAAATAFVGSCVLFFGAFVAVAPGGVGFSLESQTVRHLQVESLGGSILLALAKLHHYRDTIVQGFPNAAVLLGSAPQAIAAMGLVLVVAGCAAASLYYWRGPDDPQRLALAVSASVLSFIAFGKVLSPQYLVWLVPLVPLLGGRRAPRIVGVFLVVLLLTQIEAYYGDPLVALRWPVWIVLARNVLLLGLLGAFVIELRETGAVAGTAKPEVPPVPTLG